MKTLCSGRYLGSLTLHTLLMPVYIREQWCSSIVVSEEVYPHNWRTKETLNKIFMNIVQWYAWFQLGQDKTSSKKYRFGYEVRYKPFTQQRNSRYEAMLIITGVPKTKRTFWESKMPNEVWEWARRRRGWRRSAMLGKTRSKPQGKTLFCRISEK